MASPTNPLEGQPGTRISKANGHDADCDWHLDQYPWECTCGASWVEYRPSVAGLAPADYEDGDPVEVFVGDADGWMDARDEGPRWYVGLRYRVQPTPPRRSAQASTSSLPEGDGDRLAYPMFDGLLAYFPNALAEVAYVSMLGNQQHNPGEPMHWARGKSTDHANKAVRHLVDHGKRDARGVRHTARAAWRVLALLQEEIERDEGRPLSRASRPADPDDK